MENKILIEITNHIITQCPELRDPISEILDSTIYSNQINIDSSFAGERKLLESYVSELKIQEGFVVDIAASDGYTQSSTLGLFSRAGWQGLAVEMDPFKFAKLAKLYSHFNLCKLARNRVTPLNILNLLSAYEVPKNFSVLNLDIDSYDLHVINSMLNGGYHPSLITMEINEKIPSGIFFTVDFDEYHYWKGDHFFGCSLDAACSILKKFGYRLIKLEFNNAFFLRGDFNISSGIDLNPEKAYLEGYVNRGERMALFPWNDNVNHWLMLKPKDAILEISQFFEMYKGKFTMHTID